MHKRQERKAERRQTRAKSEKLRIVAAIVLLAAANTLPACASRRQVDLPTPRPSREPASVTITFACYEYMRSQYEALARQFHEANPGINVQILSIEELLDIGEEPWEFPLDGVQRLAGAADTMALIGLRAEDVQQGFVKDLTPLIQMDSTFDSEDFYPVALRDMQWDDGIWGLPYAIYFSMLYYDRAAFDEANLAYPEPGWTLDDFLAKAHALSEREGDQVTRWGFVEAWFDPFPFIIGRAGPLVDRSTVPPELLLNRPQVVEAVHWFADLTLVHEVMPFFDPSEQQPVRSQGRALVDGRRAAMWNQSSLDFLQEGRSHAVGMVPFPSDGPDYSPTPAWTRTYCMSAGTAHPQESWRWISFLTRQAVTIGEALTVPTRRSVADETAFWEGLSPDAAAALRFAAEHALAAKDRRAAWALYDAVIAVIKEETDVEQALAEAQEQAIRDLTGQAVAPAQATSQPIVVATPEPVQEGGTTIRFVAVYGLEHFGELADDFHASHPDVYVDVSQPISGSYSIESMATAADCYVWVAGDQDDAHGRQYMLNLQPFVDADPTFSMVDFDPKVLESFSYQGDLWALPSDTDVIVVYYNKALFDASHVAYPQPAWDLVDFAAQALALTKGGDADKQYGFLPLFPHTDVETFTALQGVSLFEEEALALYPRFDDPTTVAAIRRYVELHTVDEVSPGLFLGETLADPGTLNWQQRWELVKESKAAMWTASSYLGAPSASAVDHLGVAPLPLGENGYALGYAEGYFISPDSPNIPACWEWVRFLSDQSPRVADGLPARRSALESPGYVASVGKEMARAMRFYAEGNLRVTRPHAAWLTAPYGWLYQAVGEALQGQDVTQALTQAQDKAEAYIACLGDSQGFADKRTQTICALEVEALHEPSDAQEG